MRIKKITSIKKVRNYIAKSLYNPMFRQKKNKNKTKYDRKRFKNVYDCSIQDQEFRKYKEMD